MSLDPEQIAYRERTAARKLYQALLDALIKGDSTARALLDVTYRPIALFQKEGPDVGRQQEAESEAGRVN
jgi:hypothetical protein